MPEKQNRNARRTIRVTDDVWARIGIIQARLKAALGRQVDANEVVDDALKLLEAETSD